MPATIDSADLSLRDAEKEVRTLAEIFRHQNQLDVCELLENAHAWFEQTEYDNWNGGTYTWALRLEVPVAIFASVERRLLVIEKEIKGKLETIWRRNPSDQLGEVTVFPATPGAETLGQRTAPPEKDVQRLWPEGRFRLFLSHLATHKVEVSSLKIELAKRGVAAFVAHEDIEPSSEWQHGNSGQPKLLWGAARSGKVLEYREYRGRFT